MRRTKSYLFRCRYPFAKQEAFSGPGNGKMEPAPSSKPGSSYYPSGLSETALQRIWYDVTADKNHLLSPETKQLFSMSYSNLPGFLKSFCYLHYEEQKPLSDVANALSISISLAQQRLVVSIALFRILLASKPKNPV